jgi:citrate synthase
MLRKKLLLPVLAVTIGTAAILGVHQVSAQIADGPSDLVSAIAQKFNLPQDQVQQVFSEHQEKHHAQIQAKMEERLTQLVTDGKLTEVQKQAIISKMAEMKNSFNPDSLKDLTPEQRREKMEQFFISAILLIMACFCTSVSFPSVTN